MIEAKLMTKTSPMPQGSRLVGYINRHPAGRGGSCAVLRMQTGIEVAWDGAAVRSLPSDWRQRCEFEAA